MKEKCYAIKWALEMDIEKRPQSLAEFGDMFLQDTEWPNFESYEADLLENYVHAD